MVRGRPLPATDIKVATGYSPLETLSGTNVAATSVRDLAEARAQKQTADE